MTIADIEAARAARPSYACTDTGNAERFRDQHADKARYVGAWRTWLVWDGRCWRPDDAKRVDLLSKETARSIDLEVTRAPSDDERKKLRDHAMRSESRSARENMIALAQAELAAAPDVFDRDPWLLNVANGTIDLRTGALGPHRREDLITRVMDHVAYDPSATCPVFDAFVSKVFAGNADLISYVQKAIGYSLTGTVGEQCFFFLHGDGANGKSTFTDAMLKLLGSYAKAGAPDLLMARQHDQHPAEQADLEGARLVVCQEIAEGRSWHERTLKHLTGGDRIKARLMHQNWREFPPTHKIWIAANTKPKMRDGGPATWRRVRLIPFEVTIPPEDRDRDLPSKLARELPGILAWAVRGCLRWQAEGLAPPKAVEAATDDYREESDHVAVFVEDRLRFKEGARAAKSAVYSAYTFWAKENREEPVSREALAKRLKARGLGDTKSGSVRFWTGAEIVSSWELEPAAAA